jgi:LysR family transcriptional regulator, transcriptional activator of nhaA
VHQLNFKHLRYFWMVAKTGSVARAAEQLHLTPQSVSGQLAELEIAIATKLLKRVGRGVELTDAGRRILSYADTIFTTAGDLLAELATPNKRIAQEFRIGIADSVGKSVAYRLLEPLLELNDPIRMVCREGRLANLLSDLAVHKLDLIIADRAMPSKLNVRGYSHLLGESALSFFASKTLKKRLHGNFPDLLDQAPMLLPGEDFAIRVRLKQWLDSHRIRAEIIGEFDDSALMKEFGQAGAGVFTAPSAMASRICQRYQVVELGQATTIISQVFAITTERRVKHPAVLAIEKAAKSKIFAKHD